MDRVKPYLNVYKLGEGGVMNITFSDKDGHEDDTRLDLARFFYDEFRYLLHIKLKAQRELLGIIENQN